MEERSGLPKWDELLDDALGLIFKKLTLDELLTVIPSVCKSWGMVVMGPYCWQEIDLLSWSYYKKFGNRQHIHKMLQLLLPRTGGSLRELSVSITSNDSLWFIASHAQCLQTLKLPDSDIEDVAIEWAAPMLSTITSLDLSNCVRLGPQAFQAIGKHCKSLTSFRLFKHGGEPIVVYDDDVARAIASSMPNLKILEMHNWLLHTPVAIEIIENCTHLELLDIGGCVYVDLDKKWLEKFPKLTVLGPGPGADNDSYGDYAYVDDYDQSDDDDYVEYDDNGGWGGY